MEVILLSPCLWYCPGISGQQKEGDQASSQTPKELHLTLPYAFSVYSPCGIEITHGAELLLRLMFFPFPTSKHGSNLPANYSIPETQRQSSPTAMGDLLTIQDSCLHLATDVLRKHVLKTLAKLPAPPAHIPRRSPVLQVSTLRLSNTKEMYGG